MVCPSDQKQSLKVGSKSTWIKGRLASYLERAKSLLRSGPTSNLILTWPDSWLQSLIPDRWNKLKALSPVFVVFQLFIEKFSTLIMGYQRLPHNAGFIVWLSKGAHKEDNFFSKGLPRQYQSIFITSLDKTWKCYSFSWLWRVFTVNHPIYKYMRP